MVFIFGGAYQGKTDFAKEAFSLAEGDIFSCSGTEIDFSRRCVDNIESFTLACTRAGIDPVEYFRVHRGEWEESILICRDMFCGVVPMGAETRAWRQDTGRLTQYLSREAESEPHFLRSGAAAEMRILLLRHGITAANEKHLYCGSTDLPLSPAGRAALRRQEMPAPGTRFITSGMRRCNETLEALFGTVPYEIEPDFREIDFGDFEMKSYEMLKDDPAYQAWLTGDNEKNVPPNGESGEHMTRRALAAFARVQEAGRDAVIVTHGGVIAAIMAHLFPEGKNRYEWQSPNGGGYVIEDGEYTPFSPR